MVVPRFRLRPSTLSFLVLFLGMLAVFASVVLFQNPDGEMLALGGGGIVGGLLDALERADD